MSVHHNSPAYCFVCVAHRHLRASERDREREKGRWDGDSRALEHKSQHHDQWLTHPLARDRRGSSPSSLLTQRTNRILTTRPRPPFHCRIMKRLSRLIYDADNRQSKLSQEQLVELQKSTHFDKKELQQWYKGALDF